MIIETPKYIPNLPLHLPWITLVAGDEHPYWPHGKSSLEMMFYCWNQKHVSSWTEYLTDGDGMIVRLLLLKGCIDLLIVRSWVWVVDPNIINKFSKVLLWCNLVWLVQNSHVTWNITQSILYQCSTVTHYAKICLWYWLLNKTNKVEEMCPEAKVWQNLNRGDSNMKKTHKENFIKWKYRKLLYSTIGFCVHLTEKRSLNKNRLDRFFSTKLLCIWNKVLPKRARTVKIFNTHTK